MPKLFWSRALLLSSLLTCSFSVRAQAVGPVPALAFTKPFGGADPLPQILTIASTGVNFEFSYAASNQRGRKLVIDFGAGRQLLHYAPRIDSGGDQ